MRKILSKIVLPILTIGLLSGCGGQQVGGDPPAVAEKPPVETAVPQQSTSIKGDLTIKMLNVGQGDAILIQTKKQNILIDTSDIDERAKLVAELDKTQIKKLDRVILTHPHADHIGGLERLIKDGKLKIKEIDDNGMTSTSKIYKNYMNAAEAAGISIGHLKDGDVLDFGGGVKFKVFYPTEQLVTAGAKKDYKHDPNNESVVGLLTYKNFSMLFTGDAEKKVENDLLNSVNKSELKSTVLKSSHHGSKTSAGADFMKVVSPEYVVISAGEPDVDGGNTYGHPHKAALNAYLKCGVDDAKIFWTYMNGTITITTDGKAWSVMPEVTKEWINEWISK